MTSFALRARWILPVTSPPISGGAVSIADGQIVRVDNCAEAGMPIHDLGDVALLPGFVNAHTHLEFSQVASPLGTPGMTLPDWIKLVITSRKQREDSTAAIKQGLVESAQRGVTTIGDIATSTFPPVNRSTTPETISFHEVIGFSAARSDSVFSELQQRLGNDSRLTHIGISPHAPYTVHPQLLARLVALASQRNLPVAMHLAESREELQLLRENGGPFRELLEERSMWDDHVFSEKMSTLHYLQQLAKAPRALVVHGNYLEQPELEYAASHRNLAVVYCPRTHAFFRHQRYPLSDMIAAGVNVAIGTDSRASNPDLSVLAELRAIASRHEELDAARILQLGTLDGARALGLAREVGSLEVGKRANLTTVACAGLEVPADAILYGQGQPIRTWVGGCEVTRDFGL